MVSSISSSMNNAAMMNNGTMVRPPEGKNAFTVSDTDGNGVVSASELETLAKGIEEVTGTTINVDNALSSFDTNSDGGLSGEELLELLSGMGFAPPEMQKEQGGGPPPPPPPSSEEAISAYSQNSGSDLMTQLLDVLDSSDDEESASQTSINLTS